VATVIIGGLISSTLLDFLVHPALFWRFGRAQAEQQLLAAEEDELDEFRYIRPAAYGRTNGAAGEIEAPLAH
jgi:hypothetical protein